MDEFIQDSAKKFAKIIRARISDFQDLMPVKERFEKEFSLYKNKNKIFFLNNLKVELNSLFDSHLKKCNEPDCPQRFTFNNVSFLISQELNDIEQDLGRKKRTPVPARIRALLQKEINSLCPFCSSEDVNHFEVHHIDENPDNNSLENLLMVCPTCHSKITKKDIQKEIVCNKKRAFQNIQKQ